MKAKTSDYGIDKLNAYSTKLNEMEDAQRRRIDPKTEAPFRSAKEERDFAARVDRLKMHKDDNL